jgi:hypothetical protein
MKEEYEKERKTAQAAGVVATVPLHLFITLH